MYADPGVSISKFWKKPKGGSTTTVVPASPVAPAAPVPQSGGDFNPFSNPYYQQLQAQITAAGAQQAAGTRAAIQQALIAFGLVPEGFQDQMGALDDTTKALIEKNTQTGISGYARLLEAKKQGITDAVNRLTARGMRRTGAKGFALRRNQMNSDRALADSIAALLGQTGGLYSSYAQGEAERQMALTQMLAQVYQNYYSSHNFQSPAPPTLPGGPSGGGPGWGGGWWHSPPGGEDDSSGWWGV